MTNKRLLIELSKILENESWLAVYAEIYKCFCDPEFVKKGRVCVHDGNGREMYTVRTHIFPFKKGKVQHLPTSKDDDDKDRIAFGSVWVVGHKEATPVLFLTEKQVRIISLKYAEYPIVERKHPYNGEPFLCFPSLVQFLRILSFLFATAA